MVNSAEDFEDNEPSLERPMAEEVLLMAARLQHHNQTRLSLDEIKRTAAEVDIEPQFVDEAVRILSRRSVAPLSLADTGLILFLVALQGVVFAALRWTPTIPLILVGVVGAAVAGLLTPKNRRNMEFLTFGLLAAVIHLCLTSVVERYDVQREVMLNRGGVALAILVFAFLVAQWLAKQSGLKDVKKRVFRFRMSS